MPDTPDKTQGIDVRCAQATPRSILMRRLMDQSAKSELEWFAHHEIERMHDYITRLQEDRIAPLASKGTGTEKALRQRRELLATDDPPTAPPSPPPPTLSQAEPKWSPEVIGAVTRVLRQHRGGDTECRPCNACQRIYQKGADIIEHLQQENKRLCGEMERMKKERDEWKKEWETYTHAWNRELGPRRGKTHLIDELVVGTQKLRASANAGDKLVAEKAAADRQAKLNADVAALDSGAHP